MPDNPRNNQTPQYTNMQQSLLENRFAKSVSWGQFVHDAIDRGVMTRQQARKLNQDVGLVDIIGEPVKEAASMWERPVAEVMQRVLSADFQFPQAPKPEAPKPSVDRLFPERQALAGTPETPARLKEMGDNVANTFSSGNLISKGVNAAVWAGEAIKGAYDAGQAIPETLADAGRAVGKAVVDVAKATGPTLKEAGKQQLDWWTTPAPEWLNPKETYDNSILGRISGAFGGVGAGLDELAKDTTSRAVNALGQTSLVPGKQVPIAEGMMRKESSFKEPIIFPGQIVQTIAKNKPATTQEFISSPLAQPLMDAMEETGVITPEERKRPELVSNRLMQAGLDMSPVIEAMTNKIPEITPQKLQDSFDAWDDIIEDDIYIRSKLPQWKKITSEAAEYVTGLVTLLGMVVTIPASSKEQNYELAKQITSALTTGQIAYWNKLLEDPVNVISNRPIEASMELLPILGAIGKVTGASSKTTKAIKAFSQRSMKWAQKLADNASTDNKLANLIRRMPEDVAHAKQLLKDSTYASDPQVHRWLQDMTQLSQEEYAVVRNSFRDAAARIKRGDIDPESVRLQRGVTPQDELRTVARTPGKSATVEALPSRAGIEIEPRLMPDILESNFAKSRGITTPEQLVDAVGDMNRAEITTLQKVADRARQRIDNPITVESGVTAVPVAMEDFTIPAPVVERLLASRDFKNLGITTSEQLMEAVQQLTPAQQGGLKRRVQTIQKQIAEEQATGKPVKGSKYRKPKGSKTEDFDDISVQWRREGAPIEMSPEVTARVLNSDQMRNAGISTVEQLNDLIVNATPSQRNTLRKLVKDAHSELESPRPRAAVDESLGNIVLREGQEAVSVDVSERTLSMLVQGTKSLQEAGIESIEALQAYLGDVSPNRANTLANKIKLINKLNAEREANINTLLSLFPDNEQYVKNLPRAVEDFYNTLVSRNPSKMQKHLEALQKKNISPEEFATEAQTIRRFVRTTDFEQMRDDLFGGPKGTSKGEVGNFPPENPTIASIIANNDLLASEAIAEGIVPKSARPFKDGKIDANRVAKVAYLRKNWESPYGARIAIPNLTDELKDTLKPAIDLMQKYLGPSDLKAVSKKLEMREIAELRDSLMRRGKFTDTDNEVLYAVATAAMRESSLQIARSPELQKLVAKKIRDRYPGVSKGAATNLVQHRVLPSLLENMLDDVAIVDLPDGKGGFVSKGIKVKDLVAEVIDENPELRTKFMVQSVVEFGDELANRVREKSIGEFFKRERDRWKVEYDNDVKVAAFENDYAMNVVDKVLGNGERLPIFMDQYASDTVAKNILRLKAMNNPTFANFVTKHMEKTGVSQADAIRAVDAEWTKFANDILVGRKYVQPKPKVKEFLQTQGIEVDAILNSVNRNLNWELTMRDQSQSMMRKLAVRTAGNLTIMNPKTHFNNFVANAVLSSTVHGDTPWGAVYKALRAYYVYRQYLSGKKMAVDIPVVGLSTKTLTKRLGADPESKLRVIFDEFKNTRLIDHWIVDADAEVTQSLLGSKLVNTNKVNEALSRVYRMGDGIFKLRDAMDYSIARISDMRNMDVGSSMNLFMHYDDTIRVTKEASGKYMVSSTTGRVNVPEGVINETQMMQLAARSGSNFALSHFFSPTTAPGWIKKLRAHPVSAASQFAGWAFQAMDLPGKKGLGSRAIEGLRLPWTDDPKLARQYMGQQLGHAAWRANIAHVALADAKKDQYRELKEAFANLGEEEAYIAAKYLFDADRMARYPDLAAYYDHSRISPWEPTADVLKTAVNGGVVLWDWMLRTVGDKNVRYETAQDLKGVVPETYVRQMSDFRKAVLYQDMGKGAYLADLLKLGQMTVHPLLHTMVNILQEQRSGKVVDSSRYMKEGFRLMFGDAYVRVFDAVMGMADPNSELSSRGFAHPSEQAMAATGRFLAMALMGLGNRSVSTLDAYKRNTAKIKSNLKQAWDYDKMDGEYVRIMDDLNDQIRTAYRSGDMALHKELIQTKKDTDNLYGTFYKAFNTEISNTEHGFYNLYVDLFGKMKDAEANKRKQAEERAATPEPSSEAVIDL